MYTDYQKSFLNRIGQATVEELKELLNEVYEATYNATSHAQWFELKDVQYSVEWAIRRKTK